MTCCRSSATSVSPVTEPLSLVGFLLARIEEDERAARFCDEWDERFRETGTVRHKWVRLTADGGSSFAGGAPTPRRVLAECEAKRRIITLHEQGSGWLGDPEPRGCLLCHENDGIIERFGWCETVRALALPYADHPDFRKEWAPRGPRADRGWDNDPPWEEWRP